MSCSKAKYYLLFSKAACYAVACGCVRRDLQVTSPPMNQKDCVTRAGAAFEWWEPENERIASVGILTLPYHLYLGNTACSVTTNQKKPISAKQPIPAPGSARYYSPAKVLRSIFYQSNPQTILPIHPLQFHPHQFSFSSSTATSPAARSSRAPTSPAPRLQNSHSGANSQSRGTSR